MSNAKTGRVVQFGVLLLLLAAQLTSEAQDASEWNLEWKDAAGNSHNRSELERILGEHQKWISSGKTSGTQARLAGAKLGGAVLISYFLGDADLSRADLTGAKLDMADLTGARMDFAQLAGASLSGAKLSRAILSYANLSRANLEHADLTDASLNDTDLTGALLTDAILSRALVTHVNLSDVNLRGVNLTGANLNGTDLSGAILTFANLSDANLRDANLTGAVLTFTNLSDANLSEANLLGADLSGANVAGAIFEPKSLPQLRGIAAAKSLESLAYVANPDALFELRKQFEDKGFREQERKITYAVKHREAERSFTMCTSREPLWITAKRSGFWLRREDVPRAINVEAARAVRNSHSATCVRTRRWCSVTACGLTY